MRSKKNEYRLIKKEKKKKKLLFNKKRTEKFISMNAPNKNFKLGAFILINEKINEKIKNNFSNQIIEIRNDNNIIVKKCNPYLIKKNYKLNIENNQLIKKNNILSIITFKKQINEDIVQGLPKIEELLEARKNSKFKTLNNNPHKRIKKYFSNFSKKYENKISIRKTITKIQKFLINKIQNVYYSQGVKIADKHLEIIVKKMTSKSIITEKGNSNLLVGEIV